MKLTQIPSEICQTYMGCQESIASLNGLQYHHKLIVQRLPKLFQGNHDRFYHSKADQCTCKFWIWKSQRPGAYSGADRREPGAKSRRNIEIEIPASGINNF